MTEVSLQCRFWKIDLQKSAIPKSIGVGSMRQVSTGYNKT